jgi:uncharacterized Fe-S radical SAM superfamily protein PflX
VAVYNLVVMSDKVPDRILLGFNKLWDALSDLLEDPLVTAPDDLRQEGLDAIEYIQTRDLITCSMCRRKCRADTAHLHQGKYIGHECCWDERLRTTE